MPISILQFTNNMKYDLGINTILLKIKKYFAINISLRFQ